MQFHHPLLRRVGVYRLLTAKERSPAEKYWKDQGREIYQDMKPRMKVDNEVKRTAGKVIEDATTPEDKLQRLFRYCRNSIKNVNDPGSGLSVEERSDRKANKIPADTIR